MNHAIYDVIFDNDLEKNLNQLNTLTDMNIGDLVNSVMNGVSNVQDGYRATKILDYYYMAQRAKDVYHDDKLFSYLKRASKKEYNSIKSQKVKDFINDQVDKFLK